MIGPNGAGKTTLFNVACGFVQPDRGALSWRGTALTACARTTSPASASPAPCRALGLFDRMTVLENVMVGADRHARSGFLAALLGLPRAARTSGPLRDARDGRPRRARHRGVADRYPPSLPYPVRKRVALARALAAEPELLLLDEPASGLSDDEMDELGDLVREPRRRGCRSCSSSTTWTS